jgi:hypothetical protein
VRRFVPVVLAALALAAPAGAGPGPEPFFFSTCGVAHRSPDDPIVWPGRPGYSHDHTFVGNVSTNAFSTLKTLRRAGTSCNPAGDTAAYWAPTLYADGKPLLPASATVYYRRLTRTPVRPFPPGLRMVAGNSHAFRPQSPAVTYWDCDLVKTTFYGPNTRSGQTPAAAAPATFSGIPRCPLKTRLELHVNFPDCWDGRHLDSADHRSHMAYDRGGRCPASHPVAVPALSLVYSYLPARVDAADVVILSSGGQFSGHADFINAWNQRTLDTLVESCLDRYAYCGG